MFPIIPQYFINKTPIDVGCDSSYVMSPTQKTSQSTTFLKTYHIKSTNKLKLVVSSVIEKSAVSSDITVEELLQEREFQTVEEIRIYFHDNVIKCSTSNWSWLKHVHLAEDCHSYNIELFKESFESTLKIKSVRKILPNEQLILWFSRELLLMFQIPHLSLSNIQGEKQYICHECPFQCEMPNPLKIHLALECGKLSKKKLWKRLRKENLSVDVPHQKHSDSENNSTNLTPIPVNSENVIEEKSNSAFKPYKSIQKITAREVVKTKVQVDKVNKICSVLPNILLHNQNIEDVNQTNFLYKQAVEMETIVSNLGRFKQGHLCIYCGKVYSRKYGLKIHIRTHTGFKPLKCRYCLRPFGDPSNLNKHVRLHSEGDTPYKCDKCGKILVRKRDLDRHMKSRH